ncbi:Expansin/pollen allergen [Macleaya cordata]|uniref:Expansin/pollen allergen n=1 Tax=Macleaya cordata TaxID=56857 RepID=A0A200QDX7_MACCD|nr:Expansin/pollen allergen [Macleaya cordata]
MIAAASDALWNGGAACGSFYQVSCISGTNLGTTQPCIPGSVVVKIVDYCPPPGCRGTIDLSQEAFAMIADPNAGGINIVYQRPLRLLVHLYLNQPKQEPIYQFQHMSTGTMRYPSS